MDTGTDVNFGALSRRLLHWLARQEGCAIATGHRVIDLKPALSGWNLTIRDMATGKILHNHARFVFVGAGGGSLSLLQKAGMADRIEVLQIFYPEAKAADWKLSDAVIRVQAIKKTDGESGIVHYGTEILTNSDRTLSALLGASPGASVSVNIALGVIKHCFPDLMSSPEGKARLKEMIPTWDENIKHPDNAAFFHEMHEKSDHILQLR